MKTTLELIASETLENTGNTQTIRLKFLLISPQSTSIFVTPKNGSHIVNWSFSMSVPTNVSQFESAPLYFILIGHGIMHMDYEFSIDIQVRARYFDPKA